MIPAFTLMLVSTLIPAVEDAVCKQTVTAVYSSTEKIWEAELKAGFRMNYAAPRVILFEAKVVTACGTVEGGPYYCPADSTICVERAFFTAINSHAGLRGEKAEFANAYVLAKLVAKHVMNKTGFLKTVAEKRGTGQENEYRIRADLCASYLAGVWAHHAAKDHKYLDPKHAEEAIKTVRALGDDRIMKRAPRVVQERWDFGTAEQHVRFFSEGMKTGDFSKARIERFFSAKFDASTGTIADK
jgi:predicted metalloprotease